jgi:hypothetical protein
MNPTSEISTMELSCPTKSPPPLPSDSSVDSATIFTTEVNAVRAYVRVEERLEYVLFQITDYLAEEGRRDLFKNLTMTDLAAMIYNPNYIRWLRKEVPESML